ncbi:hypothetical protein CSB45_07175 [candidate division KSB3 bacterium]|uniref:Putative heavy-metal chelation domain-containing protein n=1 Tax=candidate division KSB3 bacterium TaxID=2044937 RepID=A0A2G6E687_9BACT|nr:MAG: hypothetical protein CSB45_07175 [candidate division KSB3 bacterium]PIE29989.1 MAG: hypothetical protein CSA57_05420 [candidate division KSB3 bacterium]
MKTLYQRLQTALQQEVVRHQLTDRRVKISCRALSAREAIGTPEHDDYPIIRGKELMVQAEFEGSCGQAFSDEFENMLYTIDDLLNIELSSNKIRASFIASLNAVYRHLGLCEKTIHCKNAEPQECASRLHTIISAEQKVVLIGFQPRFFEALAAHCQLRVIDLNPENIGKAIHSVTVEPESMTDEAIAWCDLIFATGSTLVNGTITRFLTQQKPVIFYGTTISAAAKILHLDRYCECGH